MGEWTCTCNAFDASDAGSCTCNVHGTSSSDSKTYAVAKVSTGDLIDANKWNEILSIATEEMSRRGEYLSVEYAVTGNLVYTTNYNRFAEICESWGLSITRVTTSDLISATQINTMIDSLVSAGNTCLCNCDYCACDCNYCTCNCNYCTCDCNYCTCNCNYSCTCTCNY